MLEGVNASDEPPASLRLNLLAVSLAYPPLAYPRSIQVARLLKFVNAATVLACADESEARKDATIDPEAERFLAACIRMRVRTSGRRRLPTVWPIDLTALYGSGGLCRRIIMVIGRRTFWMRSGGSKSRTISHRRCHCHFCPALYRPPDRPRTSTAVPGAMACPFQRPVGGQSV